jgi:TrmH family RNA methyltransferase
MLSKTQIKLLRSLQLKKYREEEGLFIAEGRKIIEELLDSTIGIKQIILSNTYSEQNLSLHLGKAQRGEHAPEVLKIGQADFDKISTLSTPQGILAVCKVPKHKVEPDLKKELVLALDDIRDPGNLGTIIRVADWFNIKHIYCSEESVDAFNPKVVQASMGSIVRVNVHYVPLRSTLQKLSSDGINIYGALLKGKNIYDEQLNPNGILVIGNESNGISKEVQKLITEPLRIPSYNAHGPESLNAAIATAVLCAEFRRRG